MTTRHALSTHVRGLPLINSWFAHPFLVAPIAFALYAKHSHLDKLNSFLDEPELHRSSVRIPELRGGPFIDYDGEVEDVRRFRDLTQQRCAAQLKLADAIAELYQTLPLVAKGSGVAALYAKFDEALRHRIEISYDVSKQPGVRWLESLFYDDPALFDESLQTVVFERVTDQPRAFVLSTPQLKRPPSSVEIKLPFKDPLWDQLFGGTDRPDELLAQLRPLLGAADDMRVLESMIEPVAEQTVADRQPESGVRLRYFGHACVMMQSPKITVLFDPLLSYAGESAIDHFTFEDLPERIDYVLITHPHQDHVVLETLLRIRHKVGCVVVGRAGGGNLQDISLKLMLQRCGFGQVIELDEYSSIEFDGGRIIGAPFYGEHSDLDIRAKLVYGVEMDGSSCLFFADSNPPSPEFYAPLRQRMPRIDCLFLGMECVGAPATWLYGPFLQKMLTRGEDQSRRLDGCDARRALALREYFKPERLFIYAMGAEPWITHITSILYSEDAVQFQEARQVEKAVREQSGQAEVLFGKMQLSW